ncbi:MAG: dTMP kinase [Deltaproteobacteria bacterium]
MGLFITFEGIEGSGKTTQFELLKSYLEKMGRSVLAIREPGGSVLGERIREILLNSGGVGICPVSELFLYEACRAELVKDVIGPALKSNKTVICDRFIDSTIAYQGFGRGIGIKDIERVNNMAAGGVAPDVTFLLDMDPGAGLERAWKRINATNTGINREDRFEKEGLEFHSRVREGYLRLSMAEPERIKVIDGARDVRLVHGDICAVVDKIIR